MYKDNLPYVFFSVIFCFSWCFESLQTNKDIDYTPDKQFQVTQNATKMQKMTLKHGELSLFIFLILY